MSNNLHVVEIDERNICWPFDNSQPSFSTVDGCYARNEHIDPFPAYAHDAGLVRAELARVAELFPLDLQVYVYVSSFETVGRTNAHASSGYDYNAPMVNDEYPLSTGTIVMSGKRIPLHPAMTRYLVAHEYGHLVQYRLEKAKLLNMDAYAEMRAAGEPPAHYGGRTWHLSRSEIFANDFRVVVAKREGEFWPHECPPPSLCPQLFSWWDETRRNFADVLKEGKQ